MKLKLFAKAFAKVNPYLKITNTRKDGYHELDVSYLSVNLADELAFEARPDGAVAVRTEADIPPEENLCYKVATELREVCSVDRGAEIDLEKHIPIGGGLGGGSSDAAATLIALNRVWDCQLSRRSLMDIGSDFGADIPFFFYGGYCVGGGTGGEVRRMENPYRDRLVPIITPPFSQLTGEVYSEYDRTNDGSDQEVRRPEAADHRSLTRSGIRNDLQGPATRIHPELSEYLRVLEAGSEVAASGVSGSGSSVFGISAVGASPELLRRELEDGLDSAALEGRLEIARPTGSGQLITEGE